MAWTLAKRGGGDAHETGTQTHTEKGETAHIMRSAWRLATHADSLHPSHRPAVGPRRSTGALVAQVAHEELQDFVLVLRGDDVVPRKIDLRTRCTRCTRCTNAPLQRRQGSAGRRARADAIRVPCQRRPYGASNRGARGWPAGAHACTHAGLQASASARMHANVRACACASVRARTHLCQLRRVLQARQAQVHQVLCGQAVLGNGELLLDGCVGVEDRQAERRRMKHDARVSAG